MQDQDPGGRIAVGGVWCYGEAAPRVLRLQWVRVGHRMCLQGTRT